jgi:menaquinone-dependent protoporphyrinogen oxidase
MKTVVIYTSKHGTTARIAAMLAERIPDCALLSLDEDPDPSVTGFGRVILGTPIYAGQPRGRMTRFCRKNRDVLALKNVGLFIGCMWPQQDKRTEQLKDAFPAWLHEATKAEAVLGGAFDFEALNALERMIVRKIAGVDGSVEAIDKTAIDRFAAVITGSEPER